MKRTLIFLLLPVLVLSLLGCDGSISSIDDPPAFYYLRNDPDYDSGSSIIGAERRLTATTTSEMKYLLALYLTGPVDDALHSPFPTGTALLDIVREGDRLTLTMNSAFAKLNGLELTKACACLAMTVFEITDAQSVTIQAEDAAGGVSVNIEIPRDGLLLQETVAPNP